MATSLLIDFASDPEVPIKERIKCAGMILDRGGVPSVSEQKIEVTRNDSREEKIQRVFDFCQVLGKDPRELLGNLVDALPGDCRIVEEIEQNQF